MLAGGHLKELPLSRLQPPSSLASMGSSMQHERQEEHDKSQVHVKLRSSNCTESPFSATKPATKKQLFRIKLFFF